MTPEEVLAILDAPEPKPAEVVRFEKKMAPKPVEPEAPRVSKRSWSKGSARGEGPQKQHGVVIVRRNPVQLDDTPLDVQGRKMERCTHCGEWAPRFPSYCNCMEKCPACRAWHSTATGVPPHACEVSSE